MQTAGNESDRLWKRPAVHSLLIIFAGLFVYSNTFYAPFQYDDRLYIVDNPLIKNLSCFSQPALADRVTTDYDVNTLFKRRFIGFLTFALNYRIHGATSSGYHIFNFFIHIFNSLLVYQIVRISFKDNRSIRLYPAAEPAFTALFASLLFVCHPIQTEAVTYVWQRVASLAGFFCLLSMLFYIKFRLAVCRGKKVLFYVISLISLTSAMKTKEIAFVFPAVIALYEFMFFEDAIKRRLMSLTPLLLTMLIIPASLLMQHDNAFDNPIKHMLAASNQSHSMSRPDYLYTQFRVMLTYIRLLLFPVNQNLGYDYPTYVSFFSASVFPPFLMLLLLLGSAVYMLHRFRGGRENSLFRLMSFGILWFFLLLSVESGIIPMEYPIFEYRLYLPSAGVFMAVVAGFRVVALNLLRDMPKAGRAVGVCLIFVILFFSTAAFKRNSVWCDEAALWEDVILKSPRHLKAYTNLSAAYIRRREFSKAFEVGDKAVRTYPYHADAYINRGEALSRMGLYDRAAYDFGLALALNPANSVAYNNRGQVFNELRLFDKAMVDFDAAIALKPDFADAYFNRGNSYSMQKKYAEAVLDYTKALSIKHDDGYAFNYRGIARLRTGDAEAAMSDFAMACRLGVNEGCRALTNPAEGN